MLMPLLMPRYLPRHILAENGRYERESCGSTVGPLLAIVILLHPSPAFSPIAWSQLIYPRHNSTIYLSDSFQQSIGQVLVLGQRHIREALTVPAAWRGKYPRWHH